MVYIFDFLRLSFEGIKSFLKDILLFSEWAFAPALGGRRGARRAGLPPARTGLPGGLERGRGGHSAGAGCGRWQDHGGARPRLQGGQGGPPQ